MLHEGNKTWLMHRILSDFNYLMWKQIRERHLKNIFFQPELRQRKVGICTSATCNYPEGNTFAFSLSCFRGARNCFVDASSFRKQRNCFADAAFRWHKSASSVAEIRNERGLRSQHSQVPTGLTRLYIFCCASIAVTFKKNLRCN